MKHSKPKKVNNATTTAASSSTTLKRRQPTGGKKDEHVFKKEKLEPTSKPLASIFTSSKADVQWKKHDDTLMIGQYLTLENTALEGRAKIAGFDLDNTLIKLKGTHKYPKDEHDWVWWSKDVPSRLRQLYQEGYKIVIISNQGGMEIGKKNSEQKRKDFQNKIKHISGHLDTPFQIFAGTSRDKYRKPSPGSWNHFVENENSGVPIDMENSFFVGDAAGRPENWKPDAPSDWSDTDRKFADNVKLRFHTPEEFFENAKPVPFSYGEFDPKNMPRDVPLFTPSSPPLIPEDNRCEAVLFVGLPASGKSTFAKRITAQGYTYVNMDTLKTKAKCINVYEQSLKGNKSVVIDNTNPDVESRKIYIDLAKKHTIPVRCFWFQTSEAIAKHNNIYRAHHEKTSGRKLIPEVVYNTYKSRFVEPQLSEGFEEIKRINFIFEGNEEERLKWEMWYI